MLYIQIVIHAIKEFEDLYNRKNNDGYPLYLIIKGTPIYPIEKKIITIDTDD